MQSEPVHGPAAGAGISHNLFGQRLGRKGMETRERILNAALRQLEATQEVVTLTSVAREATVGMTTLYLYFPDLGSLVMAALRRVMDSADAAFVDRLRIRWPEAELEGACLDFLQAHHRFWREHTRVLHMRNSFADASDMRFLDYRAEVSRPLIDLLVMQMDGEPGDWDSPRTNLAVVLLTGFERLATVVTNANYPLASRPHSVWDDVGHVDQMIQAEATLVTLGIRHGRSLARANAGVVADSASRSVQLTCA